MANDCCQFYEMSHFVMVNNRNKINSITLFSFSLEISSLDLSERSIKFTQNGDGIGTYDIFQYQTINGTDTYDYLTIGEYSDNDQNSERLVTRVSYVYFKFN